MQELSKINSVLTGADGKVSTTSAESLKPTVLKAVRLEKVLRLFSFFYHSRRAEIANMILNVSKSSLEYQTKCGRPVLSKDLSLVRDLNNLTGSTLVKGSTLLY